jgi:FkbM family methyltransferase
MEIVLQDSIGRAIYMYGVYEISVTRVFQAVLRPGDTLIDVGANRGYYTLLGAKLVGPSGEVHAFEPVEELRRSLERSVALNRFSGVVAHAEAVWERTGQVAFYEGMAQDNSGLSSIMPGPARSVEPKLVPSTTLDDLATRVRRIDLVKLDIEGCELPALRGAASVLGSANPPVVVFEATDAKPIAAHLRSYGYEVRAVHYSKPRGLEFPFLGQPFDNLYASYEASNFVAVAARCTRALWPPVDAG